VREQLAAQMCIMMNPSDDPIGLYILAHEGIGGIVLCGNVPTPDIVEGIAGAQSEVPNGIKMFMASDEEGGAMQRMQLLLGPLPGAQEMGTWDSHSITKTVYEYGTKLKALGVNVAIAPVADLSVEGQYMTLDERTFSEDPNEVARCVVAWQQGMHGAGLAVVPKHWPGMGSAENTHKTLSEVPPLSVLESADMIPFRAAISDGAEMIMVAHVVSEGLTEPETPATLSPQALSYLRAQIGDDVVIVSDAVHMSASTKALSLTVDEAAVKCTVAGSDMVMGIITQGNTIRALTDALDSGVLPRDQAEQSVHRILRLKATMGLLPEELQLSFK